MAGPAGRQAWGGGARASWALLALAGAALPAPAAEAPDRAAAIDAHAHPEAADPGGAVAAALEAIARGEAAQIFLMPPPFPEEDAARYDAEPILRAVGTHQPALRVLGGGGTLNALIQRSVRTGDAGPEAQRRFRERAEELLRLGVAGFGELTAEHFQGGTPYQHAPADHPLFLLLAELAARAGVPIVLHLEAIPEDMPLPAGLASPPNPGRLRADIPQLERLLRHHRGARIVWAHAGTDRTGQRTPALCRRLLAAHANLFMELKLDPQDPGRRPLLAGGGGPLDGEWLALLREFPDRFVLGSDQHYPPPAAPLQRWQALRGLLDQLPPGLRAKVAHENAARLYGRAGGGAR